MSNAAQKMTYDQAFRVAEDLRHTLSFGCKRIEIAGSIRRKCEWVGDIEIVCVPNPAVDLFDGQLEGARCMSIDLHSILDRMRDERILRSIKGGDKYKQFNVTLNPDGSPLCKLDLFIVTDTACWGVILAIRTGPKDFSHQLVTPKWMNGLLPSYLKVKDGRIYSQGKALDTPEEADVFRVCGIPWIPPEERK